MIPCRLAKYSTTKHAKPKTVWVRGRFKREHWESVEENNLVGFQKWMDDEHTDIDDTDLDGKCAIHWCAKEVGLFQLVFSS